MKDVHKFAVHMVLGVIGLLAILPPAEWLLQKWVSYWVN